MTTTGQALVPQERAPLLNFDKARLALEQATRFDEIKDIRDRFEAFRLYCRQSDQSLVMQNRCAEIKLRAERKAGQFLADGPKHQPGPRKKDRSHDGTEPPTLTELNINKNQSSRWQQVAAVPDEGFEGYIETVTANVKDGHYAELTTAGLVRSRLELKGTRLSESNDWYTPAKYVTVARDVLGGIDLDPASSDIPNDTIQAGQYFTIADNGLDQDWFGRVWLNPPYGGLAGPFTTKLVEEYGAGHVAAAVLLVSAHATDTHWFQPLWDFTLCFTNHRLNFTSPEGPKGGSNHGSVFVYFGPHPRRFEEAFGRFGRVVAAGVAEVAHG